MNAKEFEEKYMRLLTGYDDKLGYLHYLHAMDYGHEFPQKMYEELLKMTKEFDNYLFDENPVMDKDHNNILVCRDVFIFETLHAFRNNEEKYVEFFEKVIQE